MVTTIGGDHYKNFRSLAATAREKGKLVECLPKRGTAILNVDDPYVRGMAKRTRARVITYGLSPDADLRAIHVSSRWPDRLVLTVVYGNKSQCIKTKLVGEHWTTSVLAAIACGIVAGLDVASCAKAIEEFLPVFGRYSVHPTPGGATYIFDHKAPFWTIASSLVFIANARASRKTIVFGTISDYSGKAGALYRKVAREALKVADRVIFVGPHAGHVSKLRKNELREKLFAFQTPYEASKFLGQRIMAGEIIYLKGSTATDHLERVMLSRLEKVVCWKDRCGKERFCSQCKNYRRIHLPSVFAGLPKDRQLADIVSSSTTLSRPCAD